jgi:hypothetical protein
MNYKSDIINIEVIKETGELNFEKVKKRENFGLKMEKREEMINSLGKFPILLR